MIVHTLMIVAGLALATAADARGNVEAGRAKSQACAACHGADGNSTVPNFPTLAGQHRDYLLHALREYRNGKRQNPLMAAQVAELSDTDLADLAAFYASQRGLTIKY